MIEFFKGLFSTGGSIENQPIDIEIKHAEEKQQLRLFIALLVIVIGFLGISLQSVSNNNTTTLELPPKLYESGNIKVGNGWANDVMFRVWGDWLVFNTATFAPGNIRDKLNEAIRFFDQDKLAVYQGQFGALTNMVVRHNITQTFTPRSSKPEMELYTDTDMVDIGSPQDEIKAAKLTYSGVVSQSIGSKPLPDKKCQYIVTIKLSGNHLYGYSYDTDCFK